MTPEFRDPIRGGPELVRLDNSWVSTQDIVKPAVVFVHGFTSNGRYMLDLAQYTAAHGFVSLLFNYDSYKGIDQAAKDLEARLHSIEDGLKQHAYALVAHSMGGLVARFFARQAVPSLRRRLKAVVLLACPITVLSQERGSLTICIAGQTTSPGRIPTIAQSFAGQPSS